MIKVALTGGIGCGKSTVCKLFSQYHIPIIDTDILARKLVEPETPALAEIIQFFGTDILTKDGTLDRKKLANEVFNNQDSKLELESILHPKIRTEVEKKISNLSSHYVIIAIPLLIETNQQHEYDKVLVIDCSAEQQIQRTLKRDERELSEIQLIISNQISREERQRYADDIINNSGDINDLKSQVLHLHKKYLNL